MTTSPEKPIAATGDPVTRIPSSGLWAVLAIGVLIGLLYLPLLHWLGSKTLHTQQLLNGALLVVFALAICVRDAVDKLRVTVQVGNLGIGLIMLALFCCCRPVSRSRESYRSSLATPASDSSSRR